jgi:hypothetical protein
MVGRTSSSKCHNKVLILLIFLEIANLNISWQRCHDPNNGRKCKHATLINRGSDNLESMHVMFGSAHVTGASASTHGDLSDNPSDDEVHEVEKSPSDVMFSSLPKKSKKCKASSSHDIEDKEERRISFLRLYKNICSKIQEGVDKITSSVEASSTSIMSPPSFNSCRGHEDGERMWSVGENRPHAYCYFAHCET